MSREIVLIEVADGPGSFFEAWLGGDYSGRYLGDVFPEELSAYLATADREGYAVTFTRGGM